MKYFLVIIIVSLLLAGGWLIKSSLQSKNIISKMEPVEQLCLKGISVEVCPNGDFVVGRLNMQKDGDREFVYDKDGNFLYSEGGKGVERIKSNLFLQRTNPSGCLSDHKSVCRF